MMTVHFSHGMTMNPLRSFFEREWRRTLAGMVFGFLLLAMMPGMVSAASPATENKEDSLFATVFRLRGEVKAGVSGGAERSLREGDRVFIGEKIKATAASEAVLRTLDAGMVAVRPGAEFVVQGFKANGDSNDSMALRLITGSLRVISGWIGRTNPSAHKIVTPSATIGIRGTDHEPFVLTTDIRTSKAATPYRAGTYDKVNRGGTTLATEDNNLDIDAGRVGFVRAEAGSNRTRALMTLLLPVLLDKIPEFYVPGEFDAELDRFSETADALAQHDLERKLKPGTTPTPPAVPSAEPASAPAPAATPVPQPAPVPVPSGKCVPASIAKAWINALDAAITRKDADAILAQFAPDVVVKAIVRKKDGSLVEVDFSRDELVRSTLATVSQLEGYQHRRISIEAKRSSTGKTAACSPLRVKSVVIEQGRLSGKPYRFESVENYVLEVREGQWLAVRAESSQR